MGILKKLLGIESQAALPPQPSAADKWDVATRVASAYGDLLQSTDCPVPGLSTADASKLPYRKQDIKTCLIYILNRTPPGDLRNKIEFTYLNLACFQEGVGPVNAGLSPSQLTRPLNEANAKTETPTITESLAAQERWAKIVDEEMNQLQTELNQLSQRQPGNPA